MSNPSNVLSQTLQSITTTKIRELEKQRKVFESRKLKILEYANNAKDARSRLEILLEGVEGLPLAEARVTSGGGGRSSDAEFKNIRRYLSQSRYDPTISSVMLQDFEDNLRLKLEQRSRRYDFADLYSKLLVEWSNPNASEIAEVSEDGSMDGSFQLIESDRLQQLRDKFSRVVFTPRITDEVEIDNYMNSLFASDAGQAALEGLRRTIKDFDDEFLGMTAPFDVSVLQWCIEGLLKNELMNDEQKTILSDFLTNEAVMSEIANVLNMRFADLENWSWEAEKGMYYEPRRQLNGKYRIMMDEDILQAIFLHYIAVIWAVKFKECFRSIAQNETFWKGPATMTRDEEYRYNYFFDNKPEARHGMHYYKQQAFLKDYFMSSMPSTVEEGAGMYNDDDSKNKFNKSALDIRQQLLRELATEIIIRRSLHGEVAIVQSDLQWFATGLPHSTLFALLRFWGVSETFVSFFKKFAEAPLRMTNGPEAEIHIRKRGIPITDACEKLFGELTLFSMDLAINQESGMTLYRLHDDLWLCGEPSQCATAWDSMERFVKTLGLDINFSKTGSVYLSNKPNQQIAEKLPKGPVSVGLLTLAKSGQWIIDQPQVDAHIKQFKKQLAACTSVFAWVQTWNSCIGRFFQHTFGEPANCFGREHVNSILETHARMQRQLFDDTAGGSATTYLRNLIVDRIGVKDVPDCFFFLPEELGGLGLRNPFIPFMVIRDQLFKSPKKRMHDFQEYEAKAYKLAKEDFETLNENEKRRRFNRVYDEGRSNLPTALNDFMSLEEYTRHRETYSSALRRTYISLMEKPYITDVDIGMDVRDALRDLSDSHPEVALHNLDSERKWIVQLYSADLFKRFGGLSIVDKSMLPLGVMTMLRKKKVTWQMVL